MLRVVRVAAPGLREGGNGDYGKKYQRCGGFHGIPPNPGRICPSFLYVEFNPAIVIVVTV
jgi:hypothetical protein